MKKTDAIGAILFVMLVVALEAVARDRRPQWWDLMLYFGAAISLLIYFLGRVLSNTNQR